MSAGHNALDGLCEIHSCLNSLVWLLQKLRPGPVEIAETGKWGDQVLNFEGIPQPYGNHAKIGVSTNNKKPYSIFGDMNQVGSLIPWKDPKGKASDKASCNVHQNGVLWLVFSPAVVVAIIYLSHAALNDGS